MSLSRFLRLLAAMMIGASWMLVVNWLGDDLSLGNVPQVLADVGLLVLLLLCIGLLIRATLRSET